MTQDCDLEQDFKNRSATDPARAKPDKLLPCILFCEAVDADQLKATVNDPQIWRRLVRNKDERYHYLRAIDPSVDAVGTGVPALGLDFKRIFALRTDDAYGQIGSVAGRRAFLETGYREHLSSRFFYFQSRVALEEEHFRS
jgi:hypothetical protein